MEMSFLPVFSRLPKPTPEKLKAAVKLGQEMYAAAGITTAHEGATKPSDLAVLRDAAESGQLYMDVIAYPFISYTKEMLAKDPPSTFGKYKNRLKLGGIKITIDGSPQGLTAYFTTPYLVPGPNGEKNYCGTPTFPYDEFRDMVKSVYDDKLDLLVHCNGDGAIDYLLKAHEEILGPNAAGDHRTAIIHCQFVRKDQLDTISRMKLYPSFFTAHTFFFASAHITNRGLQQASFLSPMASAKKAGIQRMSNHTDFNVVPINQLFIAWTAVNRVSREGVECGLDERVDAYTAFKALTIDTAWWYREDDKKGSLEVGKLADLVILDKDPLAVPPNDIKDVKVLETIKEGKTIYKA
jgi:predicted amidohydrolase YtcJ